MKIPARLNSFARYALAATSALALAACGEEKPTFSLLPDKNVFQQSDGAFNNKLDILWVIDNSGSMQPYQDNLVANFNAFITDFATKGYDFQIAVTASDAWRAPFASQPLLAKFRDGTDATSHTGVFVINPTTPNLINVFNINARQGTAGTGDERAFQSFKEALNSNLNAGFLRPDSFLAVIILSDEDDFSHDGGNHINRDYSYANLHSIGHYVSYLDTLTGTTGANRRYSVSAMAILDDACRTDPATHPGAIIGLRYMQLVDATGGVKGSLCSPSFSDELDKIQQKIAELSTQFYLNRAPRPETIRVYVNGVEIPQSDTNGWSYHADANSIRFHGSAIPPQGATISIDFDPMTIK
ncbi:MAG TPA: hypothetical protein VFV50_16655 [Bdellovibrionales bacterium]|nr:hypothetical protein [Bdellovibrionales bacterium]